jgi:hypothetical protein
LEFAIISKEYKYAIPNIILSSQNLSAKEHDSSTEKGDVFTSLREMSLNSTMEET